MAKSLPGWMNKLVNILVGILLVGAFLGVVGLVLLVWGINHWAKPPQDELPIKGWQTARASYWRDTAAAVRTIPTRAASDSVALTRAHR